MHLEAPAELRGPTAVPHELGDDARAAAKDGAQQDLSLIHISEPTRPY